MWSKDICGILLVFACATVSSKSITQTNKDDDDRLNLTPLIEKGEIEKARNLSAVDPSLFAGVKSHAAYILANKTRTWNLFFWYFPVENLPTESTPLIIWLQGGPGCSSLYGLFSEIGPIEVIGNDTTKATRREIHWGSNYSLLFIDNPVMAGYSYSEDKSVAQNEDEVGDTLLNFLQQFLEVFPELRKAPLFITGESYAGKYIPAFGHYIHNNKNESRPINLKGLAIGDGWTDPPTLLHFSEWGTGTGLLDFKEAETLKVYEDKAREYWKQGNIEEYKKMAWRAIAIDQYLPLNTENYMQSFIPLIDDQSLKFYTSKEVKKAIHVGKTEFNKCGLSSSLHMLNDDMLMSVKPWLEELLEHYGVMCYSGQLDIIVAYSLSMHTYRSLKWSGHEQYMNADRQKILGPTEFQEEAVLGFEKSYGNFMDVLLIGAGHMVPKDQPRSAKIIIDKFINKFK